MITIFTPTYNRAYVIRTLYESLLKQTRGNFEWLVIDDGSLDNTEELIASFILEERIKIRYYKKTNGGKHSAINYGVQQAKGEWFFIVDSDDYLPADSIECVEVYINQVNDDVNFCGVSGKRVYTDGITAVTGGHDYEVLDSNAVEIREKYGFIGDMAEIWRTIILQKYPFPEYENESFFCEGFIWGSMARKYNIRYFNRAIYVGDRLADGLIASIRKNQRNSPCGTMQLYSDYMRDDRRRRLLTRIKSAINYWRYTINYRGKRAGVFCPTLWSYLFLPVGYLFYRIDLWKEKN